MTYRGRTTIMAGAALWVAAASCGVPPRYAASADVRASAQRAVVVGVVRCEQPWARRALEGVIVELHGDGQPAPMATATSGPDGVFGLASAYVASPDRPGHLRIVGRGWSGEAPLVGALDQTYTVMVSALCSAAQPDGVSLLAAVVSLQPMPLRYWDRLCLPIAGHRDLDLHCQMHRGR